MRKTFSFSAGGGEWEWMGRPALLHHLFSTKNYSGGSKVTFVFLNCL